MPRAHPAASLAICTFSSVVHIRVISNKTSHFLLRSTAQIIEPHCSCSFCLLNIYRKRNTSETQPHRCFPLQTGTRGQMGDLKSFSPWRTQGVDRPQVPLHAHTNTQITTAKPSAEHLQSACSLANSRRKVNEADETKSSIQCISLNTEKVLYQNKM